MDNENILWATKPSLVVAPGATGRKSKFRTLQPVIRFLFFKLNLLFKKRFPDPSLSLQDVLFGMSCLIILAEGTITAYSQTSITDTKGTGMSVHIIKVSVLEK